MDEFAARAELVAQVQRLDQLGLNVNSSGNLSVRLADEVLVTPSGIPANDTTADDLVLLDLDGKLAHCDQRRPTSEWQLHTALYRRRPDVHAIVHTHSPEATAAAAVGVDVPAVHYVVARFGSASLRCARYSTYGTAELAAEVVDTLGDAGMACLMANHGAICVGRSLVTAAALALDVEWFCGVHRRAVAQGSPVVLSDAEVARVADLFAGYGQ